MRKWVQEGKKDDQLHDIKVLAESLFKKTETTKTAMGDSLKNYPDFHNFLNKLNEYLGGFDAAIKDDRANNLQNNKAATICIIESFPKEGLMEKALKLSFLLEYDSKKISVDESTPELKYTIKGLRKELKTLCTRIENSLTNKLPSCEHSILN